MRFSPGRFLRMAVRVTYSSAHHFLWDDGWAMASHLALSGLMAIFPFVIFVAALAAFVGEASLADEFTDLVFKVWPLELAEPIAAEVHDVLTVRRPNILTLSVVVTLYLASNGVEAVRTGLNRAYRTPEGRSLFFRRAQSVFFVVLGAMSSLAITFLGLLGPLIWSLLVKQLPAIEPFSEAFFAGRYALLGILLTGGLVLAHLWLPNGRPKHLWPGILLTLGLWWVATEAFAAYLENFAHYSATYAGLATLVAMIFYLYVLGVIMLLGAELNAELGLLRDEVPATPKPRRHQAE